MFIFTYYWTYLLIIPGLILSVIAQVAVQNAYNKYSRIRAKSGVTADALAEKLLYENGCNVSIHPIKGNLTDNYNPRNKTLSLSQSTYGRNSVAALGVAAHEVGHAVQDEKHYVLLKFRSAIVPVVNFGSGLAVPLVILGVLLELFIENPTVGSFFITLGIAAYALATVFSLITLPVEINASRRAMHMLSESGALDGEELHGAKKVLTAAAMTYLASLLTSLLYLLRFILIVSQFRRKD